MIAQEKLEKSLEYLATSAKDYSEARGMTTWLEEQKRIVRSEAFRQARTGDVTVADAEAASYADPRYRECVDKLRDAITKESLLRAYRDGAGAVIEVWRSQEASKRAANV